ncbi:hypothetical protein HBI56_173370 [Parastagonospora nodorum]|uniref:Uncharacterized protein n=2 Tax=Phaeosphaeria nodorum (strain SN15 / ATCC MYA-4574 / FGSC 10173) TaxID=321614 RepID=A0A7U2F620_PHANO|nr:hypothetical protein SNOG_13909 [Parastagonospora nodorum SN15]KAH3905250.1 hypothetical protein HBH56_222190 [Parastagonospora nodorum]EAT78534.1 hypothetical protein SNOG_13909 [Parastagonospora nodorum SN15]KAH3924134.1 hypothetical protein HBH54_199570 [Parastagonospora nodorum]KAH3944674.1 hypothetical protein HBH53_155930 [Parastagonospora nodorum]KAH3963366.1 hypothetical protein HBH51_168780 [Parastagonospora nodorum]
MHSSILANIVLLLSILGFVAASEMPAAKLEARQVPAQLSMMEMCLDYEVTANMSTIGANSSYRTVFMQKAPVGTIITARMLNAAMAKLPALTADQMLNNACTNKTAIALQEAERNFTQGIVAQYTTEGLPVGIKAGPEVILICAAICVIFSMTWVFSG